WDGAPAEHPGEKQVTHGLKQETSRQIRNVAHMYQEIFFMLNRRTFLKFSVSSALLVAGLPAGQSVVAQHGDYGLICAFDNVNVREDPGLSGAVLGSLNTGDEIHLIGGPSVIADGYIWLQLSMMSGGLSGWAASEFFERADGRKGWFRFTPVS